MILDTKLDVETIFFLWEDRVSLLHPDYDPRLKADKFKHIVKWVLLSMRGKFSESSNFRDRYKLSKVLGESVAVGVVSKGRMTRFNRPFEELIFQVRGDQEKQRTSSIAKLR